MTRSDNYGRSELLTKETVTDKGSAENTPSLLTPRALKKGRTTRNEQRLKDRTKSCGSISQFLVKNQEAKRKRTEDQADISSNGTPTKKTNSTPLGAGESDALAISSDLPAAVEIAVDIAVDKEASDSCKMDKIFKELKRMGENNGRQFSNVSTQIAAASEEHEKNLDDLRFEIRKCKEESAQGYLELQQQIKALEQKLSAKEAATEARIKTLEKKLAEAHSSHKDPVRNADSSRLQKKVEFLDKDIRKNDIVIYGLELQQDNLKSEIDEFFSSKFGLRNCVLEVTKIQNRANRTSLEQNWEAKLSILKQKSKLKGCDLYIDQDRTAKERKVAKNLRDISKTHRAEGHTVELGYNKIFIDNITYYWDKKTKNVKKSSRTEKSDEESSMDVSPELPTGAGPSEAKN